MSGTVRSAQINKLCQRHANDAEAFGAHDHFVVLEGDCSKCYELSGRGPYNRDMTEPYEP
jgi:hypothetical protein